MNIKVNHLLSKLYASVKKNPYSCGLCIVIFLIFIPVIIFLAYFIGDNWFIWIKTSFSADGALTFYGSLLAFLSTSGLGVLALWQNRKFKQENDISQKKLETINTKLLEIDIKKSNNNLLEMYFQYMEENQKIYDAEYVLQKIEQNHDLVEIHFRLKRAEMNALSFKRRLLILDECGVSHKFFDFCEAKNQEALKIVMQEGKETSKVIKELFNFWKTNHEEFNSLALEFIYATNKRISNK